MTIVLTLAFVKPLKVILTKRFKTDLIILNVIMTTSSLYIKKFIYKKFLILVVVNLWQNDARLFLLFYF